MSYFSRQGFWNYEVFSCKNKQWLARENSSSSDKICGSFCYIKWEKNFFFFFFSLNEALFGFTRLLFSYAVLLYFNFLFSSNIIVYLDLLMSKEKYVLNLLRFLLGHFWLREKTYWHWLKNFSVFDYNDTLYVLKWLEIVIIFVINYFIFHVRNFSFSIWY